MTNNKANHKLDPHYQKAKKEGYSLWFALLFVNSI